MVQMLINREARSGQVSGNGLWFSMAPKNLRGCKAPR